MDARAEIAIVEQQNDLSFHRLAIGDAADGRELQPEALVVVGDLIVRGRILELRRALDMGTAY
jgi:hypothetical protein